MPSDMIDGVKESVVYVAAIAAVGAIAVALINNLGGWADSRRVRKKARLKHKLQSVCPHVEVSVTGRKVVVEGLWWKEPGTWMFTCRYCGAQTDPDGAERLVEVWRKASIDELENDLAPRLKAARKARRRYDAVAVE